VRGSSVRLYRGDVVTVQLGPKMATGIVRDVQGDRASVQIGRDWTWFVTGELNWDGTCIGRLPRTERGWRRLGACIDSVPVTRAGCQAVRAD
jgi:hypothetical protein